MVNVKCLGQAPMTPDYPSAESSTKSCDESEEDSEELAFITLPSLKREPGLLRVVPPSRVLYKFAEVFRENTAWTHVPYQSQAISSTAGTPLLLADEHFSADEVYYASEPASRVGAFISHVWASARWRKALALCFYLNVNLAVTLATLTWVLVISITICRLGLFGMGGKTYLIPLFVYIPIAVFFLVFFWGHYLGTPVRSMWLDKMCIHQTRDELKEKGVKALPEIVVQSDRMIILWDTTYFERLWCCAEVAIFTAVQGSAKCVDFMPLWIAPWVLSNMVIGLLSISICERLFSLIGSIGAFLAQYDFIPSDVLPLLAQFWGIGAGFFFGSLPAVPLSYFALRSKMDHHRRMLLQFKRFRLQDTKCKVEGDRDQVYGLVNKLYSEAMQPIEAFNHFVRTDLSGHVERNVGHVTKIRYRLSLLIFLPLAFSSMANILGCDGIDCRLAAPEELGPGAKPPQQMLANCFAWGIGVFAVYPSTYPVMLKMMAACERRISPSRPWRLAALQVLAIVASYAYMGFTEGMLAGLLNSTSYRFWHSSVSTSLPWCIALTTFLLFLGQWNCYLYR